MKKLRLGECNAKHFFIDKLNLIKDVLDEVIVEHQDIKP